MASTPDCRVASASLSAPAGFSGLPVSSDSASSSSLAADELLQRQLDELQALQVRFTQLGQTLRPYLDGVDPDRPRLPGSLLLAPALVEFQHRMRALARRCGHLAHRTQRQLDQARRGMHKLRGLSKHGEADHECH